MTIRRKVITLWQFVAAKQPIQIDIGPA
jgi:hypothetical protein